MPSNNKTTELLQRIADRQTSHEIKTAEIATLVSGMNTRLFGNGQPGALHFLSEATKTVDARVDTTNEKISELATRVDDGDSKSLEEVRHVDRKFIWMSGVSAGAGTILGFITQFFVGKFWHS